MVWRLAKSLITLRDQIDKLSKNRDRSADGTIGDKAHASRVSDHNPDDGGVVRALDITHDPEHGIDTYELAQALVDSRDSRIKYIISNGRKVSGNGGPQPWVWRLYTGSNKHNHHMHLSVVSSGLGDKTTPWDLSKFTVDDEKTKVEEKLPKNPVLRKNAKGPDVKRMQELLVKHGYQVEADGKFGPKTEAAVQAFQRKKNLIPDGVVGPYTWEAFRTVRA